MAFEYIRKAVEKEYPAVIDFYYGLIDDMAHLPYFPNWQKDIYPANNYLRQSINAGQLWVYDRGGIQAAMVVNTHGEEYDKAPWKSQIAPGEYLVIHALGVAVAAQGSGIAPQMVEWVKALAKAQNKKAVRLDVLQGNTPAMRLYQKCGFESVGDMVINYADTGETTFCLYECLL